MSVRQVQNPAVLPAFPTPSTGKVRPGSDPVSDFTQILRGSLSPSGFSPGQRALDAASDARAVARNLDNRAAVRASAEANRPVGTDNFSERTPDLGSAENADFDEPGGSILPRVRDEGDLPEDDRLQTLDPRDCALEAAAVQAVSAREMAAMAAASAAQTADARKTTESAQGVLSSEGGEVSPISSTSGISATDSGEGLPVLPGSLRQLLRNVPTPALTEVESAAVEGLAGDAEAGSSGDSRASAAITAAGANLVSSRNTASKSALNPTTSSAEASSRSSMAANFSASGGVSEADGAIGVTIPVENSTAVRAESDLRSQRSIVGSQSSGVVVGSSNPRLLESGGESRVPVKPDLSGLRIAAEQGGGAGTGRDASLASLLTPSGKDSPLSLPAAPVSTENATVDVLPRPQGGPQLSSPLAFAPADKPVLNPASINQSGQQTARRVAQEAGASPFQNFYGESGAGFSNSAASGFSAVGGADPDRGQVASQDKTEPVSLRGTQDAQRGNQVMQPPVTTVDTAELGADSDSGARQQDATFSNGDSRWMADASAASGAQSTAPNAAPLAPARPAAVEMSRTEFWDHIREMVQRVRSENPSHLAVEVRLQDGATVGIELRMRPTGLEASFRSESPALLRGLESQWAGFLAKDAPSLQIANAAFENRSSLGNFGDSGRGGRELREQMEDNAANAALADRKNSGTGNKPRK